MTITERNRKLTMALTILRGHVDNKMCAEDIARLNRVFRDQDLDLYEQLFNAN